MSIFWDTPEIRRKRAPFLIAPPPRASITSGSLGVGQRRGCGRRGAERDGRADEALGGRRRGHARVLEIAVRCRDRGENGFPGVVSELRVTLGLRQCEEREGRAATGGLQQLHRPALGDPQPAGLGDPVHKPSQHVGGGADGRDVPCCRWS